MDCITARSIAKATAGKGRKWLPFRLGKGVFFSLPALVGRAKLDKLKLVLWFLYRLPITEGETIKCP